METFILRTILYFITYLRVSRLQKAGGIAKRLAGVLNESFKKKLTLPEKEWVDKVELLRKELNRSTDIISFIDYGAGRSKRDSDYQGKNSFTTRNAKIGELSRRINKASILALILFKLIREFKPLLCLELGTGLGISASYQAAALKLNGGGKLITLEGANSLASIADQNFHALNLDNVTVVRGKFQDTLEDVLKSYKQLNYVFLDGHHEEKATLDYYNKILPFLSIGSVLVFDDLSWSKGMKRAWNTIITDQRIKVYVNLWQMGICLV